MQFAKYEGLGNDFIVVEGDAVEAARAHAVSLCDRHLGIGADGILAISPPRSSGMARMQVVNADGSVPEMCGNGLRCVALHLARQRGLRRTEIVIETDAGPRLCTVEDDGVEGLVTADMGNVDWKEDLVLSVEEARFPCAHVDAGNPHVVTFEPMTTAQIEWLGPRVATHPAFPFGTNVEFATLTNDAINVVVWERGVGLTAACGTGACAVAAVAVHEGWIPAGREISVTLPGGVLVVVVSARGVTMRGPARHVFSGNVAAA